MGALWGLSLLLSVARAADAKGGHGGGHCGGHGGHSAVGHAHAAHVGSGRAHALPWAQRPLDPRAIWKCGFNTVLLGTSPATVQRSCGAPETTRQVVYGDARGEHVIDVWSYQPPDAPVRILKFENGVLVSVEAAGAAR